MRQSLACLALLVCAFVGAAEETPALDPKVQAVFDRVAKMEPRAGTVSIEGANAELHLTEAYRFLGPDDARFVLCTPGAIRPRLAMG